MSNALPETESYAFGVYECALCAGGGSDPEHSTKGQLIRHRLREPIFANYAKTEILVPSGAHMFHRKCIGRATAEGAK